MARRASAGSPAARRARTRSARRLARTLPRLRDGERLEQRRRVGGLALAAQAGGVEARRHRRRDRVAALAPERAEEGGDLPGADPVLAGEVDAPEHVEEGGVLGRAAQRVDDDALGRAGAVLLHQEVRIAQRLLRRPVRELDGERQPLAHQPAVAGALVGEGHDRHHLRVARRRGQGRAHVLDRRVGAVGGDGGAGAELQRRRHGYGPRRSPSRRGRRSPRPRRSRTSISARATSMSRARVARGHAGDEAAERRDRGVGPALGEVEPGEGAQVGRLAGPGFGPGFSPAVPSGAAAARAASSARAASAPLTSSRNWARVRAGPGSAGSAAAARSTASASSGVPLLRCQLHQRRPRPGVAGEEAVHRRELGADGGVVALLLEEREAGEVQPLVAGHRGEAGLDARRAPRRYPWPAAGRRRGRGGP